MQDIVYLFSALKMEVAYGSETLVSANKFRRRSYLEH